MKPERMEEIRIMAENQVAPSYASEVFASIPELIAEVQRLRETLKLISEGMPGDWWLHKLRQELDANTRAAVDSIFLSLLGARERARMALDGEE